MQTTLLAALTITASFLLWNGHADSRGATEAEAPGSLQFTLASIEFRQDYLPSSRINELREAGLEFKPPQLSYRFFAKLPYSVIRAEKLQLKSVILEDGEALKADCVHLLGETFHGHPERYPSDWGIDLGSGGELLTIDVVTDLKRIENLKEVAGSIQLWRGKDEHVTRTGLMRDEKGFKDAETGGVVDYTSKWGSDARCIYVTLPLDRDRIVSVDVVDDQGNTIPFAAPRYEIGNVTGNDKSALIRLYLKKDKDAQFSLKINRYRDIYPEEIPIWITDVRALPSVGE